MFVLKTCNPSIFIFQHSVSLWFELSTWFFKSSAGCVGSAKHFRASSWLD